MVNFGKMGCLPSEFAAFKTGLSVQKMCYIHDGTCVHGWGLSHQLIHVPGMCSYMFTLAIGITPYVIHCRGGIFICDIGYKFQFAFRFCWLMSLFVGCWCNVVVLTVLDTHPVQGLYTMHTCTCTR